MMKLKFLTLATLTISTFTLGSSAFANDLPYLSQSQFDSCMANLRSNFAGRGVSTSTFDAYRPSVPDPTVIRSLNYQPEFKKQVWDYLAPLVDSERVMDGINAKNRHLATLQQVQNRYGVNLHHVLGVWGVESNFGQTLGKKPLFDSLATLSCFDRRQSYFRGEFANALKIVQQGHIRPQDMTGSWAGAFGQTQFMPSTFLELAVDFDGDGRKDIVNSVADSLASTANFLAKKGYRAGEPWGYEVKLNGYSGSSGRTNKKSISTWRQAGLTLTDGSPLPNNLSSAGLLLPAGRNGPAFLVGKNFDTFYAYNASESYALAIAHLSDLIAKQQTGYTAFATPWPTDDAGLSRREAKEIQQALINHGYNIGAVDGIIGDGTRSAIMDYQRKMGVTPDGRAGQKFYRLIMNNLPSKSSQYVPHGTGQGVSQVNITHAPQYQSAPHQAPAHQVISYQSSSQHSTQAPQYQTPQVTPQMRTVQDYTSWGQVRQDGSIATGAATGGYRVVVDKAGNQVVVPIK